MHILAIWFRLALHEYAIGKCAYPNENKPVSSGSKYLSTGVASWYSECSTQCGTLVSVEEGRERGEK